MSDAKASYRQILRSTSIVGGATIASLAFGLARNKAIALVAGPGGIGLFGLLSALLTTGTSIAGLNLQSTGVRQVGATPPNTAERARAETGLWLFTWLTAVVGGFAFWLFERFVYVPNTPALADKPAFPWIAVAVGLSTLGGTQLVILQIHGKIGAIASVRLLGSLLSAILAVAAVALLGTTGFYIAVFSTPLASIIVAFFHSRAISRLGWEPVGRWVFAEWRGLAVMGFGLTVAGLTGNASQLLLRSVITVHGGLAATGLFQAAWSLSNVNLSVVLSAMAVDYYPRLTARAQSPQEMAEVLNQQLHVALLLAGPILTFAVGLAPYLIRLLYSESFDSAAQVLQWQIAGDVLKLATWCLGYILLAVNATASYVVAGLAFDITVVMAVWLLYPLMGLNSTGVGYVLALALSLLTSILLVKRRGIAINRRNALWMSALFVALVGLTLLSAQSVTVGVVGGMAAFVLTLVVSWREARAMDLPLPPYLRRLTGLGTQ